MAIATVPFGDKTLAVDRENGKWAVLSTQDAATLQGHDVARGDSVRSALAAHGVGGPAYAAPSRLNTIIVKITKVCNYRCQYCYDMEPDDRLVHLPFDIAIAAIGEAIHLAKRIDGVKSDLTVILHGGEPSLFFPFIKKLVLAAEEIASQTDKRVAFTGQTNLSRLTADMVEFSTSHNIAWGVSLDGPPEINDKYRVLPDGRGTYSVFREALEKFPAYVRSMGVLSTITAANDSCLLDIARHFRDVGMSTWDWSLFTPIGRARAHADEMGYSEERLIASWNELFDAVLAGEFDGFQVQPVLDYLTNFVVGPGPYMCMRRDCGAARDLISVNSDGTLSGCDSIDRRSDIGTIGRIQLHTKDSLARAMAGQVAVKIRSRDVTNTLNCRECTWLALCGGTCLAKADGLHGIDAHMCRIAMNAFERIGHAVCHSEDLKRYWRSIFAPSANATSQTTV